MTIGGTLTVTNTSAYESFTVSFARNTQITNFTQRAMGKPGDIKAEIKNGRSGETERIYSSGEKSGKLASLDLNSKRYAIFDSLRKLDGNKEDLSESDLKKADTLVGKNGISDIRRDAKAGITTIVCNDGAVLKFDFETDAEQQVRKTKEAQEAQKAQKKKEMIEAQKQQEARELHENCKSTFEKLIKNVVGFFN